MTRTDFTQLRNGSELLKRGFARMQQGGVIMDVVDAEQAAIAEDAGAVAVMALERVPADIRKAGGVARTSHPEMIQGILDCTSIPVMAKARIGHEGEARILESMGVDMVDESEVLTPADPFFHINKKAYDIPFVCGATELGEAVRRIHEGAAMIRTKGEAGTGNLVAAVTHSRLITHKKSSKYSPWTTTSSMKQRILSWSATECLPTHRNFREPTWEHRSGRSMETCMHPFAPSLTRSRRLDDCQLLHSLLEESLLLLTHHT